MSYPLTKQDCLVLDLALAIEDPAGIEAIELAQAIFEIFNDREGKQVRLMRDSLHRWAMQWPRNCPATERNPKSAERS
jgi:flagellar biosynthesis/type III secretory pathway ATPase